MSSKVFIVAMCLGCFSPEAGERLVIVESANQLKNPTMHKTHSDNDSDSESSTQYGLSDEAPVSVADQSCRSATECKEKDIETTISIVSKEEVEEVEKEYTLKEIEKDFLETISNIILEQKYSTAKKLVLIRNLEKYIERSYYGATEIPTDFVSELLNRGKNIYEATLLSTSIDGKVVK